MKRAKDNIRFSRRYDLKDEKIKLCIFCEGTKTEVNYFTSKKIELRKSNIEIIIFGTRLSTEELVDHVTKCIQNTPDLNGPLNEFWLVFDEDNNKKKFDDAIKKANSLGYKTAYSIKCFEIWFLLHFFNYTQNSAIAASDYEKKLTEFLKYEYKKSINIYDSIKDMEPEAIKRAQKLLANTIKGKPLHQQEPLTTVHLLIERLNNI